MYHAFHVSCDQREVIIVFGIRPVSSLALMLLTGCSFMMVTGPSKQPVSETPRCSTGRGAIVADGVLTATYAVAAIAIAGNDAGNAVAIPLAIGGFHVASMMTGNERIRRCRKAYEAHDAWLAQARLQMDQTPPASTLAAAPAVTARPAAAPPVAAPPVAASAPSAAPPVAASAPSAAPPVAASAPSAAPARRPPLTAAAPAPARPDTTSKPPAERVREVPDAPSDEPWADFWVRPQ